MELEFIRRFEPLEQFKVLWSRSSCQAILKFSDGVEFPGYKLITDDEEPIPIEKLRKYFKNIDEFTFGRQTLAFKTLYTLRADLLSNEGLMFNIEMQPIFDEARDRLIQLAKEVYINLPEQEKNKANMYMLLMGSGYPRQRFTNCESGCAIKSCYY
jgi:hypothetical protein